MVLPLGPPLSPSHLEEGLVVEGRESASIEALCEAFREETERGWMTVIVISQ